jgi:ribosomal-protein-alanine N-acetyltransferase
VRREARGDAVKLHIEPATEEMFVEVASWRYDPPYDLYDGDPEPVLNPEWFFAVRDESGTLVGFYFFGERPGAVFYGLGLRPDLTGRGFGLEFVTTGITFARSRFGPCRIVLDVAEFNERALKVYERVGFRRTGNRLRDFGERGQIPFVDMELAE